MAISKEVVRVARRRVLERALARAVVTEIPLGLTIGEGRMRVSADPRLCVQHPLISSPPRRGVRGGVRYRAMHNPTFRYMRVRPLLLAVSLAVATLANAPAFAQTQATPAAALITAHVVPA